MTHNKGSVVVALSGGVDSSVTAAVLQEEGYEVSGVFMKNWSPNTLQGLSDCPWEADQADAEAVCQKLGIPFRSINFEKEYKDRVLDYFFREYNAGRTPNPDVMCNKEIKFAAFLDAAHQMGGEKMATGHYATIENGSLYRGVDPNKDQSYFLYTLQAWQLDSSMMPLGGLHKSEVRDLARRYGLPTSEKKDSQGICFIGHLDVKRFLREHIPAREGKVALLSPYKEGKSLEERVRLAQTVGAHTGLAYHTIGERIGECIDNRCYRIIRGDINVPPCYVVSKNEEIKTIYVTEKHDDPHLYAKSLVVSDWIVTGGREGGEDITQTIDVLSEKAKTGRVQCQVRYRQTPVDVSEVRLEDGRIHVTVKEPLWAVAPGQSAVLYEGNRVAGGGVITT